MNRTMRLILVLFVIFNSCFILTSCFTSRKCKCDDGGKGTFVECNEPLKYEPDKIKEAVKSVRTNMIYLVDKRHKHPICYAIVVSREVVRGVTTVVCDTLNNKKITTLEVPSVK